MMSIPEIRSAHALACILISVSPLLLLSGPFAVAILPSKSRGVVGIRTMGHGWDTSFRDTSYVPAHIIM
jgi:hypothetical protein